MAYPFSPEKLEMDNNYEVWEFKLGLYLRRINPISHVDVIIMLLPDCILSQFMHDIPEDSRTLLEIVRKTFYWYNGIPVPERRRPTLPPNLNNSGDHISRETSNLTECQSNKKNGIRNQENLMEVNGGKMSQLSQAFPAPGKLDRFTLSTEKNTRIPETEKTSVVIKKVPISLEELLERKKAEEAELNKPKFISKEERQAEALRRRQAEVQVQRDRILEENKKQREFMEKARDDSSNFPSILRIDRRARIRKQSPRYRRSTADSKSRTETSLEQEAEAIKERHLGQKRLTKRRHRRLNERKFVFDWDAKDDTSQDYNPLYKEKHQIQFFGRGHIGGIDIKEQKEMIGSFYSRLLSMYRNLKNRRYWGLSKREAKQKFDERHWSGKSTQLNSGSVEILQECTIPPEGAAVALGTVLADGGE